MASRGSLAVSGSLALEVNHAFSTFDDLVNGLGEAARRVSLLYADLKDSDEESQFELVLVGFSQSRERAEACAMFDYDRAEGAAFTPFHIGGIITPIDDLLAMDMQRRGIDPRHSTEDPLAVGLAVMRAQRERTWRTSSGLPVRGVGGFCQATIVHRDRIETRILERWQEAA